MTTYTTNLTDSSAVQTGLRLLSAPFRAVWRGLIALAEADSRMAVVRELQATSDEDLAARGTSRNTEVRRIFASSGAI